MREVAIVAPVRTPVGNFGGTLRDISAQELGTLVIKEVLNRTGLDPEKVDEVVLGNSYANGEAANIGRYCALNAGLPIEVPGYQLDRRCSSGLQAIINAALLVQTGNADVVIAGGVESMSNAEYYVTGARWGARFGSMTMHDRLVRSREKVSPEERFGYISGTIETAENLAKQYEIPRQAQDEFALQSHRRAVAAGKAGKFAQETVSVPVPQRRGDPVMFSQDEGPREDTSMEALSKLRPVMQDGTVTAGNASSQNDGASVCLVVGADKLDELDLEPMGYLVGWATAGVHPAYMGIGPVPAVSKLFDKTRLSMKEMDIIELNEAFAAQALAVLQEWKMSPEEERLNPNGSGIFLGHPIAATGARMLTTMLHDMKQRDLRYGLETMCVGGGQGVAAIFQRR